jgi:hypothetical protein
VGVAVFVMGVMEVSVDEEVDVVAVRHGLVTAAGGVDVTGVVTGAVVVGGALLRMVVADADGVLLDRAVGRHVVQVPIVDVIAVAFVGDGSVAAAIAVDVGVVGVAHGLPL